MPEKMMTFEEAKKYKMKRIPALRFMNAIGMVAWEPKGKYDDVKQLLRLLHPVSILWLFVTVMFSVVMQGVPDTFRELQATIKHETVWW